MLRPLLGKIFTRCKVTREASNWTHRDEHRSAVNQNKKRAKLNVETIRPGRETSASRLTSHTHTSVQTITVLKHLPRTAHPADVHDSDWLMAAHRPSRSPAFSRLIDAPVCLTDGQMWRGGSTQAESGTSVALPSAATSYLVRKLWEGEKSNDFELVETATGRRVVEISEWIRQAKATADQVHVPSEGMFFSLKLCERKGTASGLPGGSVGYSVCFTSATSQVSNAGLPGPGEDEIIKQSAQAG